MTIALRPITKENWQECIRLELEPEQEHLVRSNAYSLAESKFQPTYPPLAIYHNDTNDTNDTMVGFVMYGHYPGGEPPLGQTYWIFRLMVDKHHQRQGYGTAALREVLARLRADPACHEVLIGYEPENTVAAKLYQRLGFQEFTTAPWGERVMRLRLPVKMP